MYEENQILSLPLMYGKNLTFKTDDVDEGNCRELLELISCGRLNTGFLITHRMEPADIMEAYDLFEEKRDNVLKIAVKV